MNKPCEYCGLDLPVGVDKGTRRMRSYHFERCEKRPAKPVPRTDVEAVKLAFNQAIDFAIEQGAEAAAFLDAWRHGDTSEWPEFCGAEGLYR